MIDEPLADLAHHFREVVGALERTIRSAVAGGGSRDAHVRFAQSWAFAEEPLYELVELSEHNPEFGRVEAIGLLVRLSREIDLLANELDNFASDDDLFGPVQEIDLVDVLQDVADLFRTKAEARKIKLELDARSQLPVSVNARAIRRVFINLIDNAVKYSFAGAEDRPRHVRCEAWRHSVQGTCRVSIASFGVGIAAEELDRVFDRGYRSQLAREDYRDGSGIGLHEARRIVERFNGRIALTSEEQPGGAYLTTVTVNLPRSPHV